MATTITITDVPASGQVRLDFGDGLTRLIPKGEYVASIELGSSDAVVLTSTLNKHEVLYIPRALVTSPASTSITDLFNQIGPLFGSPAAGGGGGGDATLAEQQVQSAYLLTIANSTTTDATSSNQQLEIARLKLLTGETGSTIFTDGDARKNSEMKEFWYAKDQDVETPGRWSDLLSGFGFSDGSAVNTNGYYTVGVTGGAGEAIRKGRQQIPSNPQKTRVFGSRIQFHDGSAPTDEGYLQIGVWGDETYGVELARAQTAWTLRYINISIPIEIAQTDWNVDTFGAGNPNPSGYSIEMDTELQVEFHFGVNITVGLRLNGRFYPAHIFYQEDYTTWKSRLLTPRMRISGGASSNDTSITHYESFAELEGGYKPERIVVCARPTGVGPIGVTEVPLMLIRLNSAVIRKYVRIRGIRVLSQIIMGSTIGVRLWEINSAQAGTAFTGATFANTTPAAPVEFDTAATAIVTTGARLLWEGTITNNFATLIADFYDREIDSLGTDVATAVSSVYAITAFERTAGAPDKVLEVTVFLEL